YIGAFLAQALALFAKTTACTLPAAMVVMVWLRKEKLDWRRCGQLMPFAALGLVMGLVSVWWGGHLGNYNKSFGLEFTPIERLLIASHAFWFYAGKLAFPSQLTFSYPRWEINTSAPLQYLWGAGCVALGAVLLYKRKSWGRNAGL